MKPLLLTDLQCLPLGEGGVHTLGAVPRVMFTVVVALKMTLGTGEHISMETSGWGAESLWPFMSPKGST